MPGPPPKHPDKRARRNRRGEMWRTVETEPAAQPELPSRFDWPAETVAWWAAWAADPLASDFGVTAWSFLLDTALVHREVWGDPPPGARDLQGYLSELRRRVGLFGGTPADLARLRLTYVAVGDAESRARDARSLVPGARARRAPLLALPDLPPDVEPQADGTEDG